MSEYTPRTESVRDAYCHAQQEILGERGHPAHERFHAEFDRWLAEHDAQVKAKALEDVATKRWVCEVQSSGYHNGATCSPDDPHEGWRCEYRYEFSVPATRIEREGAGEED